MQSTILEKFNFKNYSPFLASYVVFAAGILGLQPDVLSLQAFLVILSFFFFKAPVLLILTLTGCFYLLGGLFLDKLSLSLGEVFLKSEVLSDLFAVMSEVAVIPLTRFNNTIYMGSFLVTTILALGIYFLFFLLVSRRGEK